MATAPASLSAEVAQRFRSSLRRTLNEERRRLRLRRKSAPFATSTPTGRLVDASSVNRSQEIAEGSYAVSNDADRINDSDYWFGDARSSARATRRRASAARGRGRQPSSRTRTRQSTKIAWRRSTHGAPVASSTYGTHSAQQPSSSVGEGDVHEHLWSQRTRASGEMRAVHLQVTSPPAPARTQTLGSSAVHRPEFARMVDEHRPNLTYDPNVFTNTDPQCRRHRLQQVADSLWRDGEEDQPRTLQPSWRPGPGRRRRTSSGDLSHSTGNTAVTRSETFSLGSQHPRHARNNLLDAYSYSPSHHVQVHVRPDEDKAEDLPRQTLSRRSSKSRRRTSVGSDSAYNEYPFGESTSLLDIDQGSKELYEQPRPHIGRYDFPDDADRDDDFANHQDKSQDTSSHARPAATAQSDHVRSEIDKTAAALEAMEVAYAELSGDLNSSLATLARVEQEQRQRYADGIRKGVELGLQTAVWTHGDILDANESKHAPNSTAGLSFQRMALSSDPPGSTGAPSRPHDQPSASASYSAVTSPCSTVSRAQLPQMPSSLDSSRMSSTLAWAPNHESANGVDRTVDLSRYDAAAASELASVAYHYASVFSPSRR